MNRLGRLIGVVSVSALAFSVTSAQAQEAPERSIAREWNELLLEAIRNDLARPTVHARNLFHTSVAMWDAWAAYDPVATTYLHHERAQADDVDAARAETLSFAAYRVLSARFARSPGAAETLPALDAMMTTLGYDSGNESVSGTTPAALGNRIAAAVLAFGETDGANEAADYGNRFYEPVNPPLLPDFPGNPEILDQNRWQPLALEFFVDQAGNVLPTGTPEFLGPEWGAVAPFAMTAQDRTMYRRGGHDYIVYHDPGPPPLLGGEGDALYRAGFEQVVAWSALLDPEDGQALDIGPGARGNNSLGTNDGGGHALNPTTGLAYAPQVVPAGDYYRVLAEFWADGPDSETPPGHWFVLANYVSDHPDVEHRIGGDGDVLDRLEWDVKLYLALGGAMHDSAVAAWGVKGWYDFIRPVSAIRAMADRGQSSNPEGPSYNPDGIALIDDVIEVVTAQTAALGERHAHLLGEEGENLGKIAVRTWRGPDYISDPGTTTAGVGWILAENWWPYQRPSFVTPPFAGYVSGHSTYSRAAAELLTAFTGDAYFPGGVGEFLARRNEFLVFEDGPSVDISLQWATYFDAADECSLSRIYGGIHPTADDIPGRLMGATIGLQALAKAQTYFAPEASVVIERARARPRKRGKGRIVLEGRIVGLDEAALDVVNGVQLTVGYGQTRLETASARSKDCRTRKNGTIMIRARRGALRGKLRPAKDAPGEYTFELKMKVSDYGDPAVAPLTVRLHTGDAVRQGTIESCRRESGKKTKLTWEPASPQ